MPLCDSVCSVFSRCTQSAECFRQGAAKARGIQAVILSRT